MNQSGLIRNANIAMIMTPKVSLTVLHDDDTVRQGLEMIRRRGYTAVPVLDARGAYLGTVTEGDFLRHVLAVGSTDLKDHEKFQISDIFSRDYCRALPIQAPAADLVATCMEQNFVPIVDDNGFLCGMVTRRSLIKYMWEHDTDFEK